MLTIDEAREQQTQNQRNSLVRFGSNLFFLAMVCIALYIISPKSVYIGFLVSFVSLTHVIRRTKIVEIFRKKEFSGKVSYFSVRTEMVKKYQSGQAGVTYTANSLTVADIAVTDKNGKTIYKSFNYNSEYDRIQNGDRAIILRFVDMPIIEFEQHKKEN